MDAISDYLQQIKLERKERGLKIPEPLGEEKTDVFQNSFNQYFSEDPDSSFINFLKLSNGLEENGHVIYASENEEEEFGIGMLENNVIWHDFEGYQKYIVYAESESLLFAYDKEGEKYLAVSQMGGRFSKSFSSCEEMLVYVMKLMLDEEE